jgi:hypothetical protein
MPYLCLLRRQNHLRQEPRKISRYFALSPKQSVEKRANMLNLTANAPFSYFSALTNPKRLAIIRLVHTIPL